MALIKIIKKQQKKADFKKSAFFVTITCLSAKTELSHNGTVAIDVTILKIVKECTTLTYKCCQGSLCAIIFTVSLEVFRQMGDTV